MNVADTDMPVRHSLTEEELSLLRHPDLVADDCEGHPDDAEPGLPGFRERLLRGDVSW